MDFLIRYTRLELKRAYKAFPKMMLGALILVLIIGSLAYCGEKFLYANEEHDKAKVALVIEDDSSLISMATTLLKFSESISTVANFIEVSPTVADRLLDNQDVIASITIHEGFMNGLMHGKNIPIDVVFSKNTHALTSIFKELSITATQTMASTESGVYAQHDMYTAHNKIDKLDKANKDLNKTYLTFAFSRDSIFDNINVSATGNVSVIIYYLSGGIVLFFLMFAMAFSSFIMNDGVILKRKLFSTRLGIYGYYLSKILIVFSMYYLIYLIFSIAGLIVKINILTIFGYMIPVLLCMSSIIVLFFEMSPNRLTGIILIFTLSVASALLSGCIIPISYLPKTLGQIGSLLPSTTMIDVVAGGLSGNTNAMSVITLLLVCILCYIATILYEKKVRYKI